MTTGLTVRRESYGLNRWRLNTLTKVGRKWIGGDFQSGLLYEVDWNYPMEGEGTPLVRERVTGNVANNQNKIEVPLVELLFQTGTPEVEPVMFVEQPDPPTITGSAPDGILGVPYAGYTYTVSGGMPPYVVTQRSGTLPPPLLLSSSGVIGTQTPTQLGTFNFKLRATDSNSLYDELDDSIDITAMMLVSAHLSANPASLASDGTDWSGSFISGTGLVDSTIVFGTPENFIGSTRDNTRTPIRTADFGATWDAGTGDNQSNAGGARNGWYSGSQDTILIAQGLSSGLLRSTDRGATWENIAGTFTSNGVCSVGDTWISSVYSAIGHTNEISASVDAGETWSAGASPADFSFQLGTAVWSHGGIARFGGTNAALTAPRIVKTPDGIALTVETLPATTGTWLPCICAGTIDAEDVWVAATEDGEILYTVNGVWTLSTDTMGCLPTGVVFNGKVFVMVGGSNADGDANGYVKSSPNGKDWTTRKTVAFTTNDIIYGVAVMGLT